MFLTPPTLKVVESSWNRKKNPLDNLFDRAQLRFDKKK
jgi:hypothetical protein